MIQFVFVFQVLEACFACLVIVITTKTKQNKGHLISKPNYRRFPSYLFCTLLLFPFHLPRCTLPDFPSASSLASLPFLSSCYHQNNKSYSALHVSDGGQSVSFKRRTIKETFVILLYTLCINKSWGLSRSTMCNDFPLNDSELWSSEKNLRPLNFFSTRRKKNKSPFQKRQPHKKHRTLNQNTNHTRSITSCVVGNLNVEIFFV